MMPKPISMDAGSGKCTQTEFSGKMKDVFFDKDDKEEISQSCKILFVVE